MPLNTSKIYKSQDRGKYLTEQLTRAGAELEYLESVLQELAQAESEQDFNDIRAELTDGGYLRAKGGKSSPSSAPASPGSSVPPPDCRFLWAAATGRTTA